MQIIPLNFHSVLLFLHNSKLAYCVKRTHLLESGITTVSNFRELFLPAYLGVSTMVLTFGDST